MPARRCSILAPAAPIWNACSCFQAMRGGTGSASPSNPRNVPSQRAMAARSMSACICPPKWASIIAGMRFAAHVDLDDQMNARVSHLRCDGDHALGPFIVGFIRPGLQKYEGATKPLFSFPGGQLKLHDVKIQGGEDVRVIANFGK